jgi:hypothetical protein
VESFPGTEEAHQHGRVCAGLVLTTVFRGSVFAASKMLVLEVPPEVGAAWSFPLSAFLHVPGVI